MNDILAYLCFIDDTSWIKDNYMICLKKDLQIFQIFSNNFKTCISNRAIMSMEKKTIEGLQKVFLWEALAFHDKSFHKNYVSVYSIAYS